LYIRFNASAVGLLLGPILALAVALTPFPGLAPQAHALAAILCLVVVFWVTEALPLPVTALLGVAVAVLLGVADSSVALSSLGSEVVFLFIGSFMLAQAMSVHGLDRRLAYALLSLPGAQRSPLLMLLLLGVTAAGLSMWVSNTAATAMLLPIALAIGRHSLGEQSEPAAARYTLALLFTLAYSASIGGLATPVGTPPNLIGIGLIHTILGQDITFFQWMQMALPLTLLMFVGAFGLLVCLYRPPLWQAARQEGYFESQRAALGPVTAGERNVAVAFGVAVVLWLLPGAAALALGQDSAFYQELQQRLPEGVVALAAALLLFLLPISWKPRRATLTWEQAVVIDWGTVLLFAGGIALGRMMLDTSLAGSLGTALVAGTGLTGESGIIAGAVGGAVLVSEAASNTASANIVIPVMTSIAKSAGINELLPALGATLGASFGFMLPVSTPPNALIYGTRQVPIWHMVRNGVLLDLAGGVILWAYLVYLAPAWAR